MSVVIKKRLPLKQYPKQLRDLHLAVLKEGTTADAVYFLENNHAALYVKKPSEVADYFDFVKEPSLGHLLITSLKFASAPQGNRYWFDLATKLGYKSDTPFFTV